MTSVVEVIRQVTHRMPMLHGREGRWCATMGCLCACFCLLSAITGLSQQTPEKPQKETVTIPPPAGAEAAQEGPLPGDWGPELLYAILSSPNEEAQSAMLRAAFAAGPAILPQLAAALQDDRTAEFAAQSVAYIGGNEAAPILWKLLSDPRDLNLRRFSYGALGEFDTPQATDILFEAINKSDNEPDRTVTESAVIALTARADAALLPRLLAAEKKVQDVVIRDDLDNARAVIEERAKYLATPEGKRSGSSIESAVRSYFIPALETSPAAPDSAPAPAKPAPGKTATAPSPAQPHPLVSVDVRSVTLSPSKERALAQVVFEDPSATANYDFILEKRYGEWTIASVWLGPEVEKPGSEAPVSGLGAGARGSGLGNRESRSEDPH